MGIHRNRFFAAAILCCLGLCACSSNVQPSAATMPSTALGTEAVVAPRIARDLNSDWKFIRHDVSGAQEFGFDDSSWQSIALPHTWNNLDGEDGGDDYYRGPGWYRRHLTLDREIGKSIFLKFYGAGSAATVYVNGKLAGPTHKGMFTAFCYDITPLVDPGGDNVIAVRVSNEIDSEIPPVSADFTFCGGLYRGVQLLALDPLSITPLDDASPGVYVKQARVSAAKADLEITSELRNGGVGDQQPAVTCDLMDDHGTVLQSATTRASISAGGEGEVQQSISVDHPHLWNARKDPYLYHVRVTVADGVNVLDRVIQPVGIRFFSVDSGKGFFLNGQSYPLHGVNRHQDRLDMGWAITSAEQEQDFDLIMEMGCSAIRLAHYQHAQEFYDLCDRGGLVVWAEACLVNTVPRSAGFDVLAQQQLRELIKQSYNHPSICFWSLFNELRDNKEKGQTDSQARQMLDHEIRLVKTLNSLAHQLDPTRLTTAATNTHKVDYALNLITDIIAYNRYDGWYTKTLADWPDELDKLREQLPGRALAISEYGAGASVIQHEFVTVQPRPSHRWHPEEWQATFHEAAWAAMKERPWLWGTFIWNMFDFASDGRREGDHLGINDKGLVSYDRKIKKDAFFFYKANWSDEPVIYITDRRFTPRNVADGFVKVYSNCDSVELKLNGKSKGSMTKPDHVFVWPTITLMRGKNLVEASGMRGGKSYTDSCTIDYDPGVVSVRPIEPATQPSTQPTMAP